MNDARELLSLLSRQGVELLVRGDKLSIHAPRGVLTATLHEQLVRHKLEIIPLITGERNSRPTNESAAAQSPTAANGPLQTRSGDESTPLSFAQHGLWFLDQLFAGSPVSNVNATLRLRGNLDLGLLEQAFNEMIRRHQALRTTFPLVNGEPIQSIAPELRLKANLIDLRALPESEREPEALRLAREQAQQPFELAVGPLIRLTLLRLAAEDHLLAFTTHHIISDGWSLGITSRELGVLYDAFAKGETSPLPSLPVQYVDYARWQRRSLRGEWLDRLATFWKRKLADAPPALSLPTDRARPAVMTFRGAHKTYLLSTRQSELLKERCRTEGVTLFMLLLAAFKIVLHHVSGEEEILVGHTIANRTRAELSSLIGVFVNTLVLRTDLSGNPTFAEVLRRVRDTALEAYEYQDLPFELLVQELQTVLDLSRAPITQVGFSMRNMPLPELQLGDLEITHEEIETGIARTDLILFMRETDQGLQGEIEYSTDLFNAATIDQLWEQYENVLALMAADPTRRIEEAAPVLALA